MEPLVGILLGSASDEPLAQKAADVLKQLNVPFEVTIASAHRTPDDAASYAKNAAGRGLKVIIAIAGLSAALPGVLASHSLLPVLGVPVSAGTLAGVDALYSVAQMPPGVPVASLGIDGAVNAALMAARILALDDFSLYEALRTYARLAAQKVHQSRETLEDLPLAPDDAFGIAQD